MNDTYSLTWTLTTSGTYCGSPRPFTASTSLDCVGQPTYLVRQIRKGCNVFRSGQTNWIPTYPDLQHPRPSRLSLTISSSSWQFRTPAHNSSLSYHSSRFEARPPSPTAYVKNGSLEALVTSPSSSSSSNGRTKFDTQGQDTPPQNQIPSRQRPQ